jgi:hypothetical protein
MQLTGEMLERVRSGAAPVAPRERRRYYDLVSASLAKCSLASDQCPLDGRDSGSTARIVAAACRSCLKRECYRRAARRIAPVQIESLSAHQDRARRVARRASPGSIGWG